MIPPQPRRVAAWLAAASVLANAQETSDVINQNLTLRFLPTNPPPSDPFCAYSHTTDALTFTTESIPAQPHCFNLAELFKGNATSGFVNQSAPNEWSESGIHWQLENAQTFDPSSNYSKILYRQAARGEESSNLAARRVNLYGGLDCTERDPKDDEGLLDWYGLSCGSSPSADSAEGEGICNTLPYGVASFAVLPVAEDEDGTCLMYAQLGAGVGGLQPLKAVASLLVGTAVAGWLVL